MPPRIPTSRSARLTIALLLIALPVAAQILPPVPYPAGNPHSAAKALLGKIIFWDEQLSDDNTVACGTCHRPEVGGGDPRCALPMSLHPGPDLIYGNADDIQGSASVLRCDPGGNFFDDGVFWPRPFIIKRKSAGFIGGQWDPLTFWDGRAPGAFIDATTNQVLLPAGATLENQSVLVPPSGTMGCQGRTWAMITQKLQTARPLRLATNLTSDIQTALATSPTYPQLFAMAFGDPAITRERAGMAMATYERTQIPDQTPFDAWLGGNPIAMTPAQINGRQVYNTLNCQACHPSPLFTDHTFRNIGVRPPAEDIGYQVTTNLASDRGKFKVPTLRNTGLRAPYFHNGRQATLSDVIAFYERGGDFTDNLDPLMQPFTLSTTDRADLIDFLQNGLTDPRCAQALAPFDRPTLFSELAANPATFGTGSAGTGGFVPRMVVSNPPMIGTARFSIAVAHGLQGVPAMLALNATQTTTVIGPHTVLVALDANLLILPTLLSGANSLAGKGYATIQTPIADNPGLAGLTLYAQWAVLDPGGVGGVAVSDATVFTFVAP